METGPEMGEEEEYYSGSEGKTVEREEGGVKEAWQSEVEGAGLLVSDNEQRKSGTDLEISSFPDMDYLYPLQQGVVLSTHVAVMRHVRITLATT